MPKISALFVLPDSIYNELGLDCWDEERDALKWPGGNPVVAHPPCRGWGQLAHMSNHSEEEKKLAVWAVDQIRIWGGVLEHPRASKLWDEMGLPKGLEVDEYGGFTMSVDQSWFGHRAKKTSLLYVCGCKRSDLPPVPLSFEPYTHVINSVRKGHPLWKPSVSKRERSATPIGFAKWLIEVARLCQPKIN